ncbi:MAG: bifunctional diaminohydroxyphosphoribosylaminopyrimidine deaminase/5-amino-6-(5-phosphoribosylamino)uracil reductase RibD [Bacteroidales bacterium]|nr:bifunctional diaminohydroxyphosphoribosylaminopyrimidine deaminase/5-amino-6-(5-phosphoribosylamino)uracil reductase RibD [Bacteroidales bacterium]
MKEDKSLQIHKIFMRRCLELAKNGLANVAPNPMVGSVVVCKGKVIGEGYHMKYGGPHAEVNAINAVSDQSLLKESSLYVSLEPCTHTGKTPPCSDLIIEKRIPRVIIGTSDPNSVVAGKGIERLRKHGIEVITDILKDECINQNTRFFTYHEKKRPYIILKWAQTRDGFIDYERKPGEPIGINWISSPLSQTMVHKWRSEEQSIMVGKGTVLYDNPKLNVRHWNGHSPLRVILDRKLTIPESAAVYNNETQTLILNKVKNGSNDKTEFVKIPDDHDDFNFVLDELYRRQIISVLVEGGKTILDYLIKADLWDEARVFIGDKEFKKGLAAPVIHSNIESETNILQDRLVIYRNSGVKDLS